MLTRMITIKKRHINELLSELTPLKTIPVETSNSIHQKIISNLTSQLLNQKIKKTQVPKLKQIITTSYYKCMAPYGESVGILSAQSLGERQTQTTLNSFHQAGNAIATVITGVPRFSELLNATKNPKAVVSKIYLKKEYKTIKDINDAVGHSIVQITFDQLLTQYEMYRDTPNQLYKVVLNPNYGITKHKTNEKSWVDIYFNIYSNIEISVSQEYYIICYLDKKLLYKYKIPLQKICDVVNTYSDLHAIPSPDSETCILLYYEHKYIKDFFESCENQFHINTTNINYIYAEDVILKQLKKQIVCGIDGIHNMYVKKEQKKWIVETQGTNLVQLFRNPLINPIKTMCNNMWDIYNLLGIEATREFLIDEFKDIVTSDGSYINIRHIMIIVDFMTFQGEIHSISRYGMKKSFSGPLAKASFEECLENFITAGIFTEKEHVNGVSSSIMCANQIQSGTGIHKLLFKI